MPDACGCYVDKGKLTMQCEFHKRRDQLIINRTALYLESRVRQLFTDTHLREMEDKVVEVIIGVRDAQSDATRS